MSNGEQTKALLAALFLKEEHFLLIDEPTNHLDVEGRRQMADYLKRKRGFILVSHDRYQSVIFCGQFNTCPSVPLPTPAFALV